LHLSDLRSGLGNSTHFRRSLHLLLLLRLQLLLHKELVDLVDVLVEEFGL